MTYDYTVEVRNRFKGLHLMTEFLKNYAQRFMTLYRRQGSAIPKKKKCKKAKWLSEETLQIAEKKKREAKKRQRRKGKIYPSECRVPKNSQER